MVVSLCNWSLYDAGTELKKLGVAYLDISKSYLKLKVKTQTNQADRRNTMKTVTKLAIVITMILWLGGAM